MVERAASIGRNNGQLDLATSHRATILHRCRPAVGARCVDVRPLQKLQKVLRIAGTLIGRIKTGAVHGLQQRRRQSPRRTVAAADDVYETRRTEMLMPEVVKQMKQISSSYLKQLRVRP